MMTNSFQIRILAFVIATMGLVLLIVLGLGIGAANYVSDILATPTRTIVVQQIVIQGVTSNPNPPTLKPGEEETAIALAHTAVAMQPRVPPFPTLTPTNLLSPLTKSPSFRLDIWLGTLVVLSGFLLVTGLEIRKRSRKKNSNPTETR